MATPPHARSKGGNAMKFCPNCGTTIEQPGGRFCPACGTSLAPPDELPPSREDALPASQGGSSEDAPTNATAMDAPTAVLPQEQTALSQHGKSPGAPDRSEDLTHSLVAPSQQTSSSPVAATSQSASGGGPRTDPGATKAAGTPRKKSTAPKIVAAALAAVLLGGGAAVAVSKFGGSDHSTDASSAPGDSSASRPDASGKKSAGTKPKSMPDLRNKSLDEAESLLNHAVKIETTKTELVEGMDGGAVIATQEPVAGTPTPDTVKITVKQPANVSYVSSSSSVVVNNDNPFYNDDAELVGKEYEHIQSLPMSGYASDEPETLGLDLNRSYSRFRTAVGVGSKSADTSKTFTVTIKSDDKQVWRQTLKFREPAREIDLDVTNTVRLTIDVSVSKGSEDTESDTSDIAFGDMRLLAEPGRGASSPTTSTN